MEKQIVSTELTHHKQECHKEKFSLMGDLIQIGKKQEGNIAGSNLANDGHQESETGQ